MAYLDVSPMITALRSNPEQFEHVRGRLRHLPSRHDFHFRPDGRVTIGARCNCSALAITYDQQAALTEAYKKWRSEYWRPIEINREFASHFRPPSYVRSVLIQLTGKLHRALISGREQHYHDDEAVVPAE